jgi:hypothetical protein
MGADVPDCTGAVEDAVAGAGEVVGLVAVADGRDDVEHPLLDGDLAGDAEDGGDGLDEEGRAGGDLEVVSELHVLHEQEGDADCFDRVGLEYLRGCGVSSGFRTR